MKNKLIHISLTCLILLILGALFSFIISLLTSFKIINVKTNDIILIILSLFLFFLLGFIFGIIEKKKGLLNGLLLCFLYIAITFSIKLFDKNYTPSSLYIIFSRSLLIIIGSVLGVNLVNRKNNN